MRAVALALGVALAGCGTTGEKVITREVPVEVRVPVTVPCVKDRPTPPTPLKDVYTQDEWEALTTDQRENLIAAQALDRKAYGEALEAATSGCR